MGKIETLLRNYERHVSLPWDYSLSGAQKVWFAIYDKTNERRLRARIDEFELATKRAGKGWILCDLTNTFAEWMSQKEYKESYFECPEDLDLSIGDFLHYVAGLVKPTLNATQVDKDTVVALLGVSCLFGFAKVSDLVAAIHSQIRGRLLVFFPGEYDNNNTYRLLDARDGWNYLAVPITDHEGIQSQ
jgi:hypothetical protein